MGLVLQQRMITQSRCPACSEDGGLVNSIAWGGMGGSGRKGGLGGLPAPPHPVVLCAGTTRSALLLLWAPPKWQFVCRGVFVSDGSSLPRWAGPHSVCLLLLEVTGVQEQALQSRVPGPSLSQFGCPSVCKPGVCFFGRCPSLPSLHCPARDGRVCFQQMCVQFISVTS